METTPNASYSLTLRVKLSSRAGTLGELTTAIGRAGGDIGAIDIVNVSPDFIIRDISVNARSSEHGERIVQAARDIDGIEVINVSDRTFLMHIGGKIEVVSKAPLKTRDDLSMAYTLLGISSLRLSERQGVADPEALRHIARLLSVVARGG